MNQRKPYEVTGVWHRNWNAVNAKDADGKRKYKYIINTGSSRSSKTYSLIDIVDYYCRSQRNKRCTVWRDTKTDCRKTVLNDTLKRFKSTGWFGFRQEYNKTEAVFSYATGSTFEIHGTDDENTVHGLTQQVAWINEGYQISREVFDQIDQRTEDFILIDWNPRLKHWIDDLSRDPRAIVIHSTFRDNPFCPPESKAKILSYQPVALSEAVIKELLTESEALAYNVVANPALLPAAILKELARCQLNEEKKSANAFNWCVYGLGTKAERPNRIFHWLPVSLQEYHALTVPVYYYCDWGAVDPWAIGEFKYYDGGLYLRELNYESENKIRERLSGTERTQIGTEEEGIVTWRFQSLGVNPDSPIVCDSNRVNKIIALRSAGYDYAIAANKKPGSIVDGIDLLNNLKVYYTAESENIAYEQENYSRKIDRYGVVQEEPEDINNHHMDGARYGALFLQDQGVIIKI